MDVSYGRGNEAVGSQEQGVKDQQTVPEVAVEVEKVENRVHVPVREKKRGERGRHDHGKCDLAEDGLWS